MTPITVAGYRRDSRARSHKKYSNAPDTQPVVDTMPDVEKLTPLAKFLAENVSPFCAKMMSHPANKRVTIYSGRSEADRLREDARTPSRGGYWVVNNFGYRDPEKAARIAENTIRIYDLESAPEKIDDWLFGRIDPAQSFEEYWNNEAAKIIAARGARVVIGESEWVAQ